MTTYERVADKILAIFSDMRITTNDLEHVAFYVVQNAIPHAAVIDRIQTFGNSVVYHDNNFVEYENDTLF